MLLILSGLFIELLSSNKKIIILSFVILIAFCFPLFSYTFLGNFLFNQSSRIKLFILKLFALGSRTRHRTNYKLITFYTKKFDVVNESKNPINPIYGQSLLKWLKEKLDGEFEISEPEPEDWGWYTVIIWKDIKYMVGSFAEKESDNLYYWQLMIEKLGGKKEKISNKTEITTNGELVNFLMTILESEPDLENVKLNAS